MNKSFEYEYKEFAAKDTPDLWSRIESGIDSDMSALENTAAAPGKVIPFYKKYGGLLAACFCIFILVPSVIISIRIRHDTSYSEKALDTGIEQNASESLYEEAPAAEAEESLSEEAPAEASAAEAEEDFAEAPAEKEDAADLLSLADGTALRNLHLTIEKIGTGIYTASVLDDPNGYFEAGDLISFTKDSYLESDFELGCSYTVTLNYYADEVISLEAIRAEKNK